MAATTLKVLFTLMVSGCLAIPSNYFSQKRPSYLDRPNTRADTSVEDLGTLPTNHAVGIAANPTNQNNLFYADETALFQFDKTTGESSMIAGQESTGLLAMRSAVDGTATASAFKYITKIISRPSALYIFDYDKLRRYDYNTKEVSTIATLTSDNYKPYPITGVVSSDEATVYWSGMSKDNGHLVMQMPLSSQDVSAAEHVTGGPTVIGHIELSADGQYLLLADVDMDLIEKVRIADGDVSFVTKYGTQGFRPGAMATNGNLLYAINQESRSIGSYDITEAHPEEQSICDERCQDHIINPIDLTYDPMDSELYVLDGAFHPTLPTYVFSIKSIPLSTQATASADVNERDFTKLLQFYSDWFSSNHRE